MIQCPNCNRENAENFNFCLDCGYDLKSLRESAAAPEPAPPQAAPAAAPPSSGMNAPTETLDAQEARAMAEQAMSQAQQPPVVQAQATPIHSPTAVTATDFEAIAAPVSGEETFQSAPAVSLADAPTEPAPASVPPAAPAAPVAAPVPSAPPPAMAAPVAAPVAAPAAAPMAPPPPSQPPAPAPPPAQAPAAVAPSVPPQPATVACPACGTGNLPNMKFCGNCGGRMDGSSPPPPTSTTPPQAAGGAAGGAGRTMFLHAADVAQIKQPVCKLITVDQSGQEGMTFQLQAEETICGRVNGVILFFDDPYVSPTHCTFLFRGGKLVVRDENSLNGVFKRQPEPRALNDQDFIRIGRQLFRFENLDRAKMEVPEAGQDDAKIWGSPTPSAFGRLVQILEDGRTGEVRLLAGDDCVVGREQGQIVFPLDGFISARHCHFKKGDGEVILEDLGSSNGTYLRLRQETELINGDVILVGNQMLKVDLS
jgi:pSer/pThr/pTyr-binding forkhead associated (FHA) protein